MHDVVDNGKGPILGEPAPFFKSTKKEGRNAFSRLKGSWIILFSHPDDLIPIFKTRIIKYILYKRRIKAAAIGNSQFTDARFGANFLEKYLVKGNLTFIADADNRIAKEYGLDSSDAGGSVKGVFVIDPKGNLRMKLFFSIDAERDFTEMLKLVDALQVADKESKQKKLTSGTKGLKLKLTRLIMPVTAERQG